MDTVWHVSSLLALKLALSPALVGGATWVQQRWGHAIGGRIIGLPLTTGPFLLIVGLQEGRSYAATAAHGIVAGQLALALFTYSYALAATRMSWWQSLGIATSIQVVTTLLLTHATPSLVALIPLNLAVILLSLFLWPQGTGQIERVAHPSWELPARILTAVAIIMTLSGFATLLGPTMAGALSTYPVIISVLGAFTQRRYGPQGTVNTLHGLMQSLPITVTIMSAAALLL